MMRDEAGGAATTIAEAAAGPTLAEGVAAARAFERQGQLDQALALLPGLRRAYPEAPVPPLLEVSLLRRVKRLDAAEALIRETIRRFPTNPKAWSEWAFVAQAHGDWAGAVERWHLMLSRFPEQIAPYLFGGVAYRELGRREAAELLLQEAQRRFAADPATFVEYAQVAQRARDWPEAVRRWAEVRARFPRHQAGYALAAAALRELGRPDEAKALLAQAADGAQKSAPEVERAGLAEARGNWAAAARAWAEASALDPRAAEPIARQANALRRAGRLDAAERLIAAALERFADAPDIAEQHGLNAAAREDFPLALARLEAAARRFPADARFGHRVYDVQLRIAGTGAAPPPLVARPDDDPDRVLAMAFESLGGTGHGCEFGIFQRSLGADTLGLLRWADLGNEALCTALETEFPGVGEPEFTRLFVPTPSPADRPEYWATDHRFHMAMRTFVYAHDVPPDRMAQAFAQRQRFLRRKLIEDLRESRKIFVYKNMRRNLSDAELARLHAAVRRYGDATLFCIRYAGAGDCAGEVEIAGPGLILGNIDHFSHHPETDEFLGSAHAMLLTLCRKAYAAFQERRTGAAA